MLRTLLPMVGIACLFSSCSGNKAPKHEEMPDQLTVTKSSAHVHFRNSPFYMIPIEGTTKESTLGKGFTFSEASGLTKVFMSESTKGVVYPETIDGKREDLAKTKSGKVTVIKYITYNGMKGIYSESISMDKFYDAEIQVKTKKGTFLFINGSYTNKTPDETVAKIFNAMKTAYYDDNRDYVNGTAGAFALDDSRSSFKFAGTDKDNTSYYTLDGKERGNTAKEPVVLFFTAKKIAVERGTGKQTYDPQLKDAFLSLKDELVKYGYKILNTGTIRSFTLGGKPARETPIDGLMPDGTPVSMLLTEVNEDRDIVAILGVVKDGNRSVYEDFRKLAATLKILDID